MHEQLASVSSQDFADGVAGALVAVTPAGHLLYWNKGAAPANTLGAMRVSANEIGR